jgi:Rrf2 family protein
MLRVENEPSTGPLTADQISKGCKFPPRFLCRILRRLVDAGLLTGASGPGGGYSLAKPAREISLLEIIEAVEGKHEKDELPAVSQKFKAAFDSINEINERLAETTQKALAKVTLEKLSKM